MGARMDASVTTEYAERFAAEFTKLRNSLRSLAAVNELEYEERSAQTFSEGAIRLARAAFWVEIVVRRPEELGTGPEMESAWGITVLDHLNGRRHQFALWPEAWRERNHITKGWHEIGDLGAAVGRYVLPLLKSTTLIVTGWNNGAHHESGAGYGVKIDPADRDRFFSIDWKDVLIQFPDGTQATVNVDKNSFWGSTCSELISIDIGRWLRSEGLAPWPASNPPKLGLKPLGGNTFVLNRGRN